MLLLHKQVKAKEDLKKIWRYSYKEHGLKQADLYYDELIKGMALIQENPHIGISCEHIRSGYRQLPVNEHHIFYRISTTKIHIIRVLHRKMKFRKHL